MLVDAQGDAPINVANLEIRQSYLAATRALPFYIEDLVTDDRALVRIRYDARHVDLRILKTDVISNGQLVQVQGMPCSMDQLQVPEAPTTRTHGQGHIAEGRETVARHHDSSGVDLAMSAIAGAEGGFASTEGSDAGVFTWGQGQWTVTESDSNLQDVLSFIKERRPDLFAHHFGARGLDINGRVLRYQGQDYAFNREQMTSLFRSSPERNRILVELFAQAGTDPQVQRLQRQFLRREVEHTLSNTVSRNGASHTPTNWLTPRGLALYYSMYKNLPDFAERYLLAAINGAGGGAGAEVTPAMRQQASQELEQSFRTSSVKARDPQNENRWYSFWGEEGRQQAIQQAEERLTALRAQLTATVDPHARQSLVARIADWQQHRARVQQRESRYQKTIGSLGENHIEEPLPTDARKSMVTQPQPPPSDPSLGSEDPEHKMSTGPAMSLPLNSAQERPE